MMENGIQMKLKLEMALLVCGFVDLFSFIYFQFSSFPFDLISFPATIQSSFSDHEDTVRKGNKQHKKKKV